jgi:hypothetical protein
VLSLSKKLRKLSFKGFCDMKNVNVTRKVKTNKKIIEKIIEKFFKYFVYIILCINYSNNVKIKKIN